MEIRATPASDYGLGDGFVIEQRRYWNFNLDDKSWAMPAWDEIGYSNLEGVFPTRRAAERAIRDA